MTKVPGMTMVGNEFSAGAHRSLSIYKIENGYLVKAKFRAPAEVTYEKTVTKEFCFYTDTEMLRFIGDYFAASKEDLS